MQAEVELLELSGIRVDSLLDGLGTALSRLEELETLVAGVPGPLDISVTVIDDDGRLAELTAIRLRRRGVRATFSQDLSILPDMHHPGAVVIDLSVLTQATAVQLASLRQHRLVVVSGHSQDEARDEARRIGASAFLVKPVPIHRLLAAILSPPAEST